MNPVFFTPLRTSELIKFVILIFAGGFGGWIYAIVSLLESGRNEHGDWIVPHRCSMKFFMGGQAVVGVGGAFAALFGTLTLGNAVHPQPNEDFTSSALYFVSLCVIGGFVGNNLLAGVGERVRKQLTDLKESTADLKEQTAEAVLTAREAGSKAENAEIVANEAKELGLMTSIARTLVDKLDELPAGQPIPSQLHSDAEAVLAKLNRLKGSFPVARTLYVPLANLMFSLNRASEALNHLAEVIENRKIAELPRDGDDAALSYNMACYYSLLSASDLRSKGYDQPEEPIDDLKNKALRSLETCLDISQRCGRTELSRRLERISGDNDLAPLRALEAFKKLIARYAGNQPG